MAPPPVLSRFSVVLLDMNGTVMFGGDRFSSEQDFAATYRALGGRRLEPDVVQETIATCYATMGAIYEDPARCDTFPAVSETLRELSAGRNLPAAELELLERVIATHELGRIPDPYALAIQRLAARHRLGLVANVLSRKGPWLDEFARAGVLHHFVTTVFSSDGSSIKPSRKLFDQAVTALAAPRSEVVFVGDSLRCDIGGAAAAGLATVWIDRNGHGRQARDPEPSFVVRDLLDLVT